MNYNPQQLKENFKFVLELLQTDIRDSYTSKLGVEEFEKPFPFKRGDKEYTVHLRINEKGLCVLKVDGFESEAEYGVGFVTGPAPENTLFNISPQCALVNSENIKESELEFFKSMDVLVLSGFQRVVAFNFISRMQAATIDNISNRLVGTYEYYTNLNKSEESRIIIP